MATSAVKSVLLIGGGHAMMPVVRHLREHIPDSVQVSLVSDHPYLYYSGMVPEYLGGVYEENQVRLDLESLCERHGIGWELGRVVGLDTKRMAVELSDGRTLNADIFAFDVGSVTPGVSGGEHDIVAKPLHYIRRLADDVDDLILNEREGSIAIVGGGAAGVEVALNVANRIRKNELDQQLRLHLYEGNERVLPTFKSSLSADVLQQLIESGVQVELKSRPHKVSNNVLSTPLGEREYKTILWATGTRGPQFFEQAELLTDSRGFVHTDRYLRVLGRKDIFVAGDSALVEGYEKLERIGVHAVKQGPVLLKNLVARINGREPTHTFKPYPISPIIISTGTRAAWWVAGRFWFRNSMALGLKHHIDRKWIHPWLDPAYRSAYLWDYKNAAGI
jgi:NADH dehydrogenase FAD-containing subunit